MQYAIIRDRMIKNVSSAVRWLHHLVITSGKLSNSLSLSFHMQKNNNKSNLKGCARIKHDHVSMVFSTLSEI